MIRRLPPTIALLIHAQDRLQIQTVHHVADEQRQVPFREPVAKRGRQQIELIRIVGLECLHACQYSPKTILVHQFFCDVRHKTFSDRLLGLSDKGNGDLSKRVISTNVFARSRTLQACERYALAYSFVRNSKPECKERFLS